MCLGPVNFLQHFTPFNIICNCLFKLANFRLDCNFLFSLNNGQIITKFKSSYFYPLILMFRSYFDMSRKFVKCTEMTKT